jgi:multiple sugar transport system substrate-binding protein
MTPRMPPRRYRDIGLARGGGDLVPPRRPIQQEPKGGSTVLKKSLLATVFGLALAVAATADARTSLTFSSWQLEEPGNADWWKAVIADFKAANPDIDVETVYIPFNDFLTQLTIRFASNRPPSVLQISEQNYGAYAAQGWLAPLDDRIKGTAIATEWAAPQKDLTWDGKTRGVLVSNSAMMLLYNDKLLKDAGVAVPKSWAEYKAAVAKLTDAKTGIFGLSAVTTQHPTLVEDMHRYTLWAGTSLVKNGKYNLTSPEVVAAIDAYRTTVGKNAPLGNNSAVARQLFIDGRTAFLIDGPWITSWLDRAKPEMKPNLKMIRAPFDKQGAPGGITLHIAAGLDKPTEDAAWKFILHATQEKWQRAYIMQTGQPAGRARSVLTPEDEKAFPVLKIVSDAAAEGVPLFPTDQRVRANFAEYSAILMKAGLRALSTTDPTAKILGDAEADLKRAIPLD